MKIRLTLCVLLVAGLSLPARGDVSGLKVGTPAVQSAGPLAFGPEGVLLLGDPQGAAVFAIATGDTTGNPAKVKLEVEQLRVKVAETLKTRPQSVRIVDLAVNPLSGNVYLSVSAGGKPVVVRIDGKGKLSPLPLQKVRFSKATLPDAPENKPIRKGRRVSNPRRECITDIAFVEGQVLVSGLAKAAGGRTASTVRSLSFPPSAADPGAELEIYHGAHGRFENNRAARTIVPFRIGNELHVLAAYTCTPLVKFPVSTLSPRKRTRGTTVAELGNRNRPLDMIAYTKDGKRFLLIINSARGVMKVNTDDIQRAEGITTPVRGGKTAGQNYETVKGLTGVIQLDKLNDASAVVIVQGASGRLDLRTIPLP